MKMDAGEDVLRAQALLLKLFMLIGGAKCNEYIKALSASLMLWSHCEQRDHPCWQLFKHNASAFNEESGEISLSVLARDISRGGVRSDCKKVHGQQLSVTNWISIKSCQIKIGCTLPE